jgi:hypothetical protein
MMCVSQGATRRPNELRLLMQAYSDDDGKDEDKANTTSDLLRQVHGGTLPSPHNPPPFDESTARPRTRRRHESIDTATGFTKEQAPAPLPQSATATVSKSSSTLPAETPEPVEMDTMNEQEADELNQLLRVLAETLFGSSQTGRLEKRSEALPYLNRMREEIGLEIVKDDSFPALLAAAKESAETVGCV